MIHQLIHRCSQHSFLKKNVSSVPTGLHPLSSFRSVAILIDPSGEDLESAMDTAGKYFGGLGIDVNFYCSKQDPEDVCTEDLLISLIDNTDFFVRFTATCSRAITKIGRVQIPGKVFDIVVNGSGDRKSNQDEALKAIIDLLPKIK